MLIADCGTTWTKIVTVERNERSLCVKPTKDILQDRTLFFERGTGHMAKSRCRRYENELVALASGALQRIESPDFTVVDVGSRDTKFVSFKERRLARMDWNQACGASTGFTLELLSRYYEVDYADLAPSSLEIAITCGVFAIEKVFDAILQGAAPSEALARMVKGVARSVHAFAGSPERLYLSGGLCENSCFLRSLEAFTEVIPLGRDVLLDGLCAMDA